MVKKRIEWTNDMLQDLLNFRDLALQRKKTERSSYLKILKELFQEKYPDLDVSETLLQSRIYAYEKSCKDGHSDRKENQPAPNKNIEWTDEMIQDLLNFRDAALVQKKESTHHVSYLTILKKPISREVP